MKLGRNDPCHCGSGKKYKYCHYEADRAAEAEALRKAAEERAKAEGDSALSEEDEEHHGHKHHGGSYFMRNSGHGSHNKKASGGAETPRSTRGAQRGS